MRNRILQSSALALLLVTATPVWAEPIVNVSGPVSSAATVTVHEFDLAKLEALGEKAIRTKIVSLQGEHEATGPLMRDVLASLNLKGTTVEATALDGYQVDIPVEDFMKYDVILATRIDGKLLSVRDKGPSWIIYPVSQHPELDDTTVEAKSVWQVMNLVVK